MKIKKIYSALLIAMPTIAMLGVNPVQAQDKDEIEVIEVKGIRGSLQTAQNFKREASSVMDSIAAEDIGKFPDQNVAESLQRVTGVSLQRDNGEGTKITVRGFGPEFNTVSINNRTLATVTRGREFDFRMLAPELIIGADVVKSPTASMTEGSIGASINIRTARPLSGSKGLKIAGSAEARYSELSEETTPKFSGLISNTFLDDTFGALFTFSYNDQKDRTDVMSARWNVQELNENFTTPNEGDVVTTYQVPDRVRYRLENDERSRLGLSTVLQWQPNDTFESTLDIFYTQLEQDRLANGLHIPLQFVPFEDAVVSNDNSILFANKTTNPVDLTHRENEHKSDTYSIGWNVKYQGDNYNISADVSHSKADVKESSMFLSPGVHKSEGSGQIDGRQNNMIFYNTDYDIANDSSKINSHVALIETTARADEITELKLDSSWYIDKGIMSTLDVGLLYMDREQDNQLSDFPGCTVCGRRSSNHLSDSLFSSSTHDNFLGNVGGVFEREWLEITDSKALIEDQRQFYVDRMTENINKSFAKGEITAVERDGKISLLSADDFFKPTLNLPASSANKERTFGGYVQLNLEGDMGDMPWSANVGLRHIKTEQSSTGTGEEVINISSRDGGDTTSMIFESRPTEGFTRSKNYSNWLPSANFSLDLSDTTVLRFAAAKVMTRPTMQATGVAEVIRAENFFNASISGGNPDLEPFEAIQYDAAIEFYLENGDSYGINLFYKDIDTFISESTSLVSVIQGQEYDIEGLGLLKFNESRPQNRSGGKVQGVELAANHNFDYLPGFLAGFGIQANYTYADTEDELANEGFDIPHATAPSAGLEGFAKNSFNIIGYYDMHGVQVRLAYNWRDTYLLTRQGEQEMPVHVKAYGQFDLSASYDITENITISSSAINITDENAERYADIEERLLLVSNSGPRYQLGIRINF